MLIVVVADWYAGAFWQFTIGRIEMGFLCIFITVCSREGVRVMAVVFVFLFFLYTITTAVDGGFYSSLVLVCWILCDWCESVTYEILYLLFIFIFLHNDYGSAFV